jgi:hypothetical protein
VDTKRIKKAGTFAQAVEDLRLIAAKERGRSGGIHVR